MKKIKIIVTAVIITLIATSNLSCKKSEPTDPINSCSDTLTKLESEIITDLNAANTDTDFTLTIKSENGKTFTHSTGNSKASIPYQSASTSKLVTTVVILSLVKDNKLSLEDHPQDYIATWPTTGNLSKIQLNHLLSFTSGLVNEPICINSSNSNFETCVGNIATSNGISKLPGEEFYYSSTHLQVAGLMAIKASGLSSWQEVFEQFKFNTGLFSNANYDLPSLQNPRLAGGMHWSGEEYLEFLKRIYKKEILNAELIDLMTSDQISNATIGYSPALVGISEDWHYGFGNWIECHANPNNCAQTKRISSPGAFGAYPFIDYENKYYGILARQGAFGTFKNGYTLFESVSPKLEKWAAVECN